MKKRVLSLLLCLCLLASVLAVPAAAEVTEENKLEVVRILGILVGDQHGALNLEQPVTRAQFAKMMVAASPFKDSVASGSGTSLFKDVKSTHWSSGYIKIAVEQQWIIGYVDGTFRPDRTITLEEGCTALLRVLGYDASTLVGSYPAAQLNKAEAVGLRDDLSCKKGSVLTRMDCVKLFYNLLVSAGSNGQTYGSILGCSVKNKEVDYTTLVALDTKGPFVSVDGTVKLPFSSENLTVYRDGKTAALDELQPEDVYYYHENLRTVWACSEKVTGTISGNNGNTVTVAGKTYPVTASAAAYALSGQGIFRDGDVATLLLGKDNDVVLIRDATAEERNTFFYEDAPDTIAADTEGPFVIFDGVTDVPFTLEEATIYRNGRTASVTDLANMDVYYYHENLKTIWVYSDRVSGTLTAVLPNRVSPTSVTVSGKTYPIAKGAATYELSNQGSFRDGDSVTLLLGMNDDVVRVLPAGKINSVYFGVVLSDTVAAGSETTGTSAVSTQNITQIACSDGTERTFYHTGTKIETGKLASVVINASGTTVKELSELHLSGTVSSTGKTIGTYTFAENVEILDTDDHGNYIKTYPARLAGATLSSSAVRYYTLDAAGKIDRLILNEVTGDQWDYCYILSAASRSVGMSASGSYTYLKDGQPGSISGSTVYPVKDYSGAVMVYREGKLKNLRTLGTAKLTSVSDQIAISGGRQYNVAENVQVILKDATRSDSYYGTTLDDLELSRYELTGWFDDLTNGAGGRIRIIVAVEKP